MFFKTPGYEFLSNMYPCNIQLSNGLIFPCVESAYVAHKPEKLDLRCQSLNGYQAKRLGRKLQLRKDWDEVKVPIMRELLFIKFKHPVLRDKLVAVTEELVEDNTWNDTFWGRCKGIGDNNLGKLLTEVRDFIALCN